MIIREATRSDAESMIQYVYQVADETPYLSFGAGEFTITKHEEERVIEIHRQAKNRIFILAILEGEIAGMLNVVANNKPRMRHIGEFGITVEKKYWGLGIGDSLMKSMIDWAQHSGIIRKLNLKVQTHNTAAINLYKKYGFKKEGLITRDSYIDGVFYDTYMMGLLIDEST